LPVPPMAWDFPASLTATSVCALHMLRDPLVHFLAAGAALFAFFIWRGDASAPERIVVTGAQVERVRQAAALLEGREPTSAELEALLEPMIREEIYYREALALGLDQNDDEVRTRLIEKMRYLTEDIADPQPASVEELQAFYERDPARFMIPERVTFDQVFFSPSQRGEGIEGDVAQALEALRSGAPPAEVGDRTPLESRLVDAGRERIAILFGEALTAAVFSAEPGVWLGPYRSDFGLHLVRLVERSAARQPPFAEIEAQVRETFGEDRRRAANEAAYRDMRARYAVEIEWPEALASETAGP
jgi:hypothetical protein